MDERTAEGVPGAEAVDDLDGERGDLDTLVGGRGEHTPGALLDDASSTPRSSRASAARCGSVSPTATSHSSRLPTATVT